MTGGYARIRKRTLGARTLREAAFQPQTPEDALGELGGPVCSRMTPEAAKTWRALFAAPAGPGSR